MKVTIREAQSEDLDEILELQKRAFRAEGELYGDLRIPPLTQTQGDIEDEFQRCRFLKAVVDGRIVGSVRAHLVEGTCHIGRLVVHPDYQGRGIGTRLMAEIEARFPQAERFEIFTGHRSAGNLRLYERLGYRRFREQRVSEALTMVFMAKPQAGG